MCQINDTLHDVDRPTGARSAHLAGVRARPDRVRGGWAAHGPLSPPNASQPSRRFAEVFAPGCVQSTERRASWGSASDKSSGSRGPAPRLPALFGEVLAALPLLCAAIIANAPAAQAASAASPASPPPRYIVTYTSGAPSVHKATASLERRVDVEPDQLYRYAVDGFAARMTPAQLATVKKDHPLGATPRHRQQEEQQK
jgi:hypothetical protein